MENDKMDELSMNTIDDDTLEDAVGGMGGHSNKLVTTLPKHVCSNGLDLSRIGFFGKNGTIVPSTSLGPNGEQLFKCTRCGTVGYIEFCANRKFCYLRPCKGSSGPVQL